MLHQTRITVFGSVIATVDGTITHLGGPRAARILATLVLHRDPVSLDALTEGVWALDAPASAHQQLRKAIGQLRRALPEGKDLLQTHGSNYLLDRTRCSADLWEFETHLRCVRTLIATGDVESAKDAFLHALSMWQPLLNNDDREPFAAFTRSTRQDLLSVADALFDAALAAGPGTDLVPLMAKSVELEPFSESLSAKFMVALARSARQAEALQHYEQLRQRLADELGVDPAPQLQDVYLAILQAQDTVKSHGAVSSLIEREGKWEGVPSLPRGVTNMPRGVRDFQGRSADVAELLACARSGGQLLTISAMGGMGKSSLALHVARQLRDTFPDAQLYLNLHTYSDDSGSAPNTFTALEHLLVPLGIPVAALGANESARLSQWRQITQERNVLLVIDDAASAEQIQPLLTVGSGSITIVTSRHQLSASDPDCEIHLQPMSTDDAAALLAELAPSTSDEPDDVIRLVAKVGHLPLAVRLLGNRLRSQSALSVEELCDQLDDTRAPLATLKDSQRSIAAMIDLSLAAIPPRPRATLEVLAHFPVASGLTLGAGAAWVNAQLVDVRDDLDQLAAASLVSETGSGTFVVHDVLRTAVRGRCDQQWLQAAERRLRSYLTQSSQQTLAAFHVATAAAQPGGASTERAATEPNHAREPHSGAALHAAASAKSDSPADEDPDPAFDVRPFSTVRDVHRWYLQHRALLRHLLTHSTIIAAPDYWNIFRPYASHLFLTGDAVRGLELATVAAERAKANGAIAEEQMALMTKGTFENQLGRRSIATVTFTTASELAGTRAGHIRCLQSLAINYAQVGRATRGLELLDGVADELGDHDHVQWFQALNATSYVALLADQPTRAQQAVDDMRRLSQRVIGTGIPFSRDDIVPFLQARIWQAQERWAEAEPALQEALEHTVRNRTSSVTPELMARLAWNFAERADRPAYDAIVRRADRIHAATFSLDHIPSYYFLGRAAATWGHAERAEALLGTAYRLAKQSEYAVYVNAAAKLLR